MQNGIINLKMFKQQWLLSIVYLSKEEVTPAVKNKQGSPRSLTQLTGDLTPALNSSLYLMAQA